MSEENPYAAPSSEPTNAPTDSAIPGPHNYATRGERLLGVIIDGLIMVPIGMVLGLVFGMMFTVTAVADPSFLDTLSGGAGFGILPTLLLSFVSMVIYIAIQWTFWNATGQSIGKKVMKTKIVNLDGTQADVQTIAFKRYGVMTILSMIPFAGGIIGLINGLMVFRGEHNCLHDDIAKTRVIKIQVPQV